jgi:hypothetical protein
MILKEKDIEMFKTLSQSETGKWLSDFLERLNKSLFEPETLTTDNLEARKSAKVIIEKEVINRIKQVEEKTTPTSYE